MPIIKSVPAEKTTPKSETTSKENGKGSVASFKQNPYYSPLYDCDVNYFRYAFSSDSLTIKSAVAIKSIDIKPLKKEDQKKTKSNKTAEVKLNETITTEKTNELKTENAEIAKKSATPKLMNNSLSKSKSMIANSKPLETTPKEEKVTPIKTQNMPIKKSKSIIALNKKDGNDSKFSTVKKSVKFKNEDIVKEIKIEKSISKIETPKQEPLNPNPTPLLSNKQTETPKVVNNSKTIKANETNKDVKTSITTPVNQVKPNEPKQTPVKSNLAVVKSIEPVKNITNTIIKPVEANKVNNNNNKNNSQNKPAEVAKSSSNITNIPVQINKTPQIKPVEAIKAPTIASKPIDLNKSLNILNNVHKTTDVSKSLNNPSSTEVKTSKSNMTHAKSVENLKTAINSLVKSKPFDVMSRSVNISSKPSDPIKNETLITNQHKAPDSKPASIQLNVPRANSVGKSNETASLKNITNIPVHHPPNLANQNKNISKSSFGLQNNVPTSNSPLNKSKTVVLKAPTFPVTTSKPAEITSRPNIISNPTQKLATKPPVSLATTILLSDIVDFENYIEYDLAEVERSKSPDLTYRLSNLNQEIKIRERGKESANVSSVELSPTFTPSVVTPPSSNPPSIKTKSPILKSVTFSNISEELPNKSPTEPIVPILVKATSPVQKNQEKVVEKIVEKLLEKPTEKPIEENKSMQTIKPVEPILPITPVLTPPLPVISPTNSITPPISPKMISNDETESVQEVVSPSILSEPENYNKNQTQSEVESSETVQQQVKF